tara:strand:- start:1577 stop:2038 length:462 start_codon:yes stop_codon:yes gene_type:complete
MDIIEPESMYVIENLNQEFDQVQNQNIELQKQLREKDRKIELMELLRKNQLTICLWDRKLQTGLNGPHPEWCRANFWAFEGKAIASMFNYELSENFTESLTGFCVYDNYADIPIENMANYDEMVHLEGLLKDEMLYIFPKEEFNFIDDSSDEE